MKIIITEKQLNKLLNEQVPMSNLIGNAADFGVSTPDFVGVSSTETSGKCKNPKNSKELMIELFKYARSTQGQPKQTDQKIQEKVNKLGKTSNFTNVMSTISSIEELGAVLNGYAKFYGYNLSTKIDNEIAKEIWNKVSKFAKGVIKQYCKDNNGSITLSA